MAERKPIRTACYIRISLASDSSDGSYEVQRDYFMNLVTNDPNRVLVDIYGDYGKSGREMKRRDGMNRLISDCRAGLIDEVLCKSVSRFARNMTQFISTVRELKSLGIACIFEKENLNTMDGNSELLLGIFGVIAQEESNSISQNQRWSREKHLMSGEPWNKPRYGYHMVKKGHKWVISKDEGKIVQTGFYMAGKGCCYSEIRDEMNKLEEERGSTRKWTNPTVVSMLKSLVYTGDYLSNTEITVVTKTGKKRVKNKGEVDQIFIEEHHEPLVSHELYNVIQEMISERLLHSRRSGFSPDDFTLFRRAEQIVDGEAERMKAIHEQWETAASE